MKYANMSAAVRRDLAKGKDPKVDCTPGTCPYPDDLCLGCRNAQNCKSEEPHDRI